MCDIELGKKQSQAMPVGIRYSALVIVGIMFDATVYLLQFLQKAN